MLLKFFNNSDHPPSGIFPLSYLFLTLAAVNKNRKAHIAILAANIIYAANFPIAKEVMGFIPPFALVLLRSLGGIILFWSAGLAFANEKVEKKDLLRLLALAPLGVVVNQLLFLKGLHLTSPINAAIMMITTPILVLVIANILIRDKITLLKSSGIVLGFSGAAFLVYQNLYGNYKESSFLGDICVFINAVSWGTFLVLVKPLMQKYHTVTILKWCFLFGFPFVFPFGSGELAGVEWQNIPLKIYLFLAVVIILTTFVAYLLNIYALRELSPSVVSAYIYLQPLLTALISVFIFKNDAFTWGKFISAILIFTGVYLVSFREKKQEAV